MRSSFSICVNGWMEFKKTWRCTDFVTQFNGMSTAQIQDLVQCKLDELLLDEDCLCYLFPQTLSEQHREIIINVSSLQQYCSKFRCEFQSLFFGQPKQLLVYQRNCPSLICYLRRYRLPKKYKQLFTNAHKACMRNYNLLINRNVLISHRDYKSLHELQQSLKQFYEREYSKPIEEFMEFVRSLLLQFKSQQSRAQMILEGTNSQIRLLISQLCSQLKDLYVYDRHYKTESQQIRDIKIVKLHEPTLQDDKPIQHYKSVRNTEQWINQASTDNQHTYKAAQQIPNLHTSTPQSRILHIQQITPISFSHLSIKFKITLHPFTKIKKPLTVNLKTTPKFSQTQSLSINKHYETEHSLLVNFSFDKNATLTNDKNHQIYQCQFTVVNQFGISAPKTICILYDNHYRQSQLLYILGNNNEGLIPNFELLKQTSYSCLNSTDDKWMQVNMQCHDYSVGSAVVMVDNSGNVAVWGQMNLLATQQLPIAIEQESVVFDGRDQCASSRQQHEQVQTINNIQHYAIERPTLIAENTLIVKVSCGRNYCLMLDITGRVWATGNNDLGQLGIHQQPLNIQNDDLFEIVALRKHFIAEIKASMNCTSFAIDNNGKLFRWGLNQIESSLLPIRDAFNYIINYEYPSDMLVGQSSPLMITTRMIDEPVESVYSNIVGTVFIVTRNKKLYAWGNTKYMGLRKVANGLEAVQRVCNPIFVMNEVRKIAVGHYHCVIEKQDGQFVGWGRKQCLSVTHSNKYEDTIYSQPVPINAQHVIDFACGPSFTLFVKSSAENTYAEIIGDKLKFPLGRYPLPVFPHKIQVAEGVVIIQ